MAVTTLLPTTVAGYATHHQSRLADTAIALFPRVHKCNKPNLVIAQSAIISGTLVYFLSSNPGNSGQRNLPILLTQAKHFMKVSKMLF